MPISKVQLPDNTTQDINDARITSSDITSWDNKESFYFVVGTSSAAGNGTSGSYLSTKWEGVLPSGVTLVDGLKVAYRIKTNTGVGTAGAVLSIDGGTTYKPVVYNVNSVISTRYSVDSTILLTYNATQTAPAYLTSNTKSTVTGCWQIMDYDTNSYAYVREYQHGSNAAGTAPEYPILTRYNVTNKNGSYDTAYTRYHTGATINTNTGAITATSFKKTGGTSSQFLKADGSVDNNSYALASESLATLALVIEEGTGGEYTSVGTKAAFASTFEITEANVDSLLAGEIDVIDVSTGGPVVFGYKVGYDSSSHEVLYSTGDYLCGFKYSGSTYYYKWGAITTTESDPVFSASAASGITSSDITNWNSKQSALTFDSTPTSGSTNPVTSGGVYLAFNNAVHKTGDETISDVKTFAEARFSDQIFVDNSSSSEDDHGVFISYEDSTTGYDGEAVVFSGPNDTIRLSNLNDPISDSDAATKYYVDNAIPTKTSDLTNDSGFLTSESSLSLSTSGSGNAITALSVNGHAITATKGTTFSTTDKNLQTSDIDSLYVSSSRTFYPILDTGASTGTKSLDTYGIKFVLPSSRVEEPTEAILVLGNGDVYGNGRTNKNGILRIYNKYNKYVDLRYPTSLSSNISVVLPSSAGTLALISDIPTVPTKTSDLTNDSGFLTSYTETDPTVPSWAKESSKPSYTASEVGAVPTTRTVNGKALSSDITLTASDVSALPSSTSIPTKTSDLTNDSNFQSLAYIAISSASSSKTLAWNTVYQWTVNPTSISLTLPSAPSDSRGEIVLKFTTGSTAPTVTWPSGLKWANGEEITPEASTTYEFSIGYDMMGGFTILGCGFTSAS